MNKCVFIEENKLFLDSYLDEQAFGHTDLGKMISDKGVLAEVRRDFSIEKKSWTFDENRPGPEGTVRFEGKTFEGKTLLDAFENDKPESSRPEALAVLKVLDTLISDASDNDCQVFPGAGGILVSEPDSDGSIKVLILPGLLFDRCAENSRNYGELQGIFNHKGLSGLEACLFTRAVIAYRTLTLKYPFTETDLSKRQADFYDRNFIPVCWMVNGCPTRLANSIDAGLCVKNKKKPVPGERRFASSDDEKKRQNVIKAAGNFNAESLEDYLATPEENRTTFPENQFTLRREKYISKQKRTLKLHRFYKRNNRRIWGTVAAVIVAAYALNSYHKENMKLATTKGLTSSQTVEALFTAIHHADVPALQEMVTGSETKSMLQLVSGYFVSNKQREANEVGAMTCTPSEYLEKKCPLNYWQYGITGLEIDGEKTAPEFNYPRRSDKPSSITEENGKSLKKGDEVTRQVKYNLVHNEGDWEIVVISAAETATLRWNGKCWLVKSIKGKHRTNSYKVKDYKADYLAALEKTGDDKAAAAGILKEKYPFAPDALELSVATDSQSSK